MVTTEALFFRDTLPFQTLRTVALTLANAFPELESWDVRILATDTSQEMLARSAAGLYSQTEVNRDLPPELLARYFRPEDGAWQLADEIRRRVEFRALNLVKPCPRWRVWTSSFSAT